MSLYDGEIKPRKSSGRKSMLSDELKQKAIDLYVNSDMTVHQIADECGFSHQTLYRILHANGYQGKNDNKKY